MRQLDSRKNGPGTSGSILLTCALATLMATALPGTSRAQGVVSEFDGSIEKGVYESPFATLATPTAVALDAPVQRAEGHLTSRIFTKPAARSNLEVFRSYQRELEASGFTIRVAATAGRDTELLARRLYSEHTPGFVDRRYGGSGATAGRGELARLGSQAEFYLAASRSEGGRELWVAVVICRYNDLYMVEELATAAMKEGTVSINGERLRSAIDSTGRIAIYDIHFATGSAEIRPESSAALAVIAEYLNQASDTFYIVGHTDDTGTLERNLTLSAARASAVRDALVSQHKVAASRLESRGVGPLSPVSANRDEAGRALNRRVEIVQRLKGQ
ncbi:MAG: OmpA family protein [Bryobacterales bacterium]|nr:OmpA family protein [Bryobacterales bacterium]